MTEAFNAMITTTALLSSFLAAGVFIDPNSLKSGVAQGVFNALCLFITALYFCIGCLIYTKMPVPPVDKKAIENLQKSSPNEDITKNIRMLQLDYAYLAASCGLIVSGILLVTGLSVFLIQVLCVQFDSSLIPNCRAASIGLTAWFVLVIVLGIVGFLLDYCKYGKEISKLTNEIYQHQI